MERKDKREVFTALWGKYKAVMMILAAGILLLTWPSGETQRAEAGNDGSGEAAMETLTETEERMEKLLRRIDGVGELKLMLTLERGVQQELALDTELSYRGAAASPEDYSRSSETVLVSGDEGDAPVVVYRVAPAYRGAVVVCQGAENAGVRLAVTQAVSALTGLGSDRIMVIKCQS